MTGRLRAVILWGLTLVALIALQMTLQNEAVRLIPGAALLERPGLSLTDYLRGGGDLSACGYISARAVVSLPGTTKTKTVRVVYTDARYAGITGLRMQEGAFLPELSPHAVVISDALAAEWFFSTDISGAEIVIGGNTYAVCGIYREEDSLAAKLSQTGVAEVYLPFAALTDKKTSLEGLLLPLEAREFLARAADDAGKRYESFVSTYLQTDFREARLLAGQSGRVLWFLLGVPAVGWLLLLFLRRFPGLYRDIRAIQRGYDRVSRGQKRALWKEGGLCLLLLLGAALLVRFMIFDLYMPPGWISDGFGSVRFFDRFPARFIERFIAETQKLNASGHNFWAVYARRMLLWLYATDIFAAIAGLFTLRALSRLRRGRDGVRGDNVMQQG